MKRKTFVVAPDSFKESMTAQEACEAMEQGILRVLPDARVLKCPMADGGEGTLAVLVAAQNGSYRTLTVHGPLEDQLVSAKYGLIAEQQTAIIEMAEACGLGLVPHDQRHPLLTSSYGVGELIGDAIAQGAKTIVLTLGGSATNDAGAGMLQALGGQLLTSEKHPISWGNQGLGALATIDLTECQKLSGIQFILVSDVNNPLLGARGATAVFAKQKGATLTEEVTLEANIKQFVKLLEKATKEVHKIPGTGAAGGLAIPLLALTSARFVSGIEYVAQKTKLADAIRQADWVLTGEGGIDFQTKFGKTPYGVAQVAKHYDKPTIAFAGTIGEDTQTLYAEGFTAIFGILTKATTLAEALDAGADNLANAVENVVRVIQILHDA